MEHLEELLLQQSNPVAKAEYFGLLFDKTPTYAEIKYELKPLQLTWVNELFKLKSFKSSELGEPAWYRTRFTIPCSSQTQKHIQF